jgi:hypothetical protein
LFWRNAKAARIKGAVSLVLLSPIRLWLLYVPQGVTFYIPRLATGCFHLRVFYGSHKTQRLFPYTTFTIGLYVELKRSVFTARKAVRRHLSTRRPGFGARPGLMRFVVDRVALEQGSVPVLRFSYDHITPPMRHIHPHMYVCCYRRTNGQNVRPFQKAVPFRKSENIG